MGILINFETSKSDNLLESSFENYIYFLFYYIIFSC